MSTKKVTIINEGLLKNDTQSSNKDRLREEFGSWYSKVNGFKFIERSSDLSFEVESLSDTGYAGTDFVDDTSNLSSDFYKFRQKVTFGQQISVDFGDDWLTPDIQA